MRPETRGFLWGMVLTFAGTWAYHAFIRPLPTTKTGG
jgi:hypothetical protein